MSTLRDPLRCAHAMLALADADGDPFRAKEARRRMGSSGGRGGGGNGGLNSM